MTLNKLLYIHGASSSGASSTAKNISELLPHTKVIAPDLPVNPKEALSLLHEICKSEIPDVVIGTSMGGMFAQQMHGFRKILVNPAFHVSEFMRRNLGIQPFLNERKDGATFYEITSSLCDEYKKIESRQFEQICSIDKEYTFALFGDKDELVNCKDEYLHYYKNYKLFSGGHRLTLENIQNDIIPLLKSSFFNGL